MYKCTYYQKKMFTDMYTVHKLIVRRQMSSTRNAN